MAHALYRSINYYNRIFCASLGILSRLTGSYLPFSKISGDDSSIYFLCDRSNSRASRQHLPKITKLATFLPHCFFMLFYIDALQQRPCIISYKKPRGLGSLGLSGQCSKDQLGKNAQARAG
jgi:hypothetical protein